MDKRCGPSSPLRYFFGVKTGERDFAADISSRRVLDLNTLAPGARPETGERLIRCALITHAASGWFTDALLTAPGLEFVAPNRRLLQADNEVNPYELPEADDWDVTIINIEWLKWKAASGLTDLDASLDPLRRRSIAVVGLEGYDGFALATPPVILERLDLLIKAQGVFRDLALYNWRVGPYYPGGVWGAKLNPRTTRYSHQELSKLRLSIPCFLQVDRRARNAVRGIKPGVSPATRISRQIADLFLALAARAYRAYPRGAGIGAHFIGALTHVQRAQLVEAMTAAGVRGTFGITGVHESYFGGPL